MLHEKLHCYQLAVTVATQLHGIMRRWPRGYGYLADQAKRAIASVVLNLAEGNGRVTRPDRRRFFHIARSSAGEVAACLDLMHAFELIAPHDEAILKSQLTRVTKMIYRLYQPSQS